MPVPSELVAGLPALVPFVGPETLERRLSRPFLLRLGANESPFGPSRLALEAMRAQAANAQNYGDPEGWELRTALAKHHGISMDNLVLAAGIDDLLALLCRAFGNPGDALVTTLGSYPTLEYGALGAGLHIHRVAYGAPSRDSMNPLPSEARAAVGEGRVRGKTNSSLPNPNVIGPAQAIKVDLAALSKKAHETNAKIVYLANPDNPSGSCHPWSAIAEFRASLPADSLLLVDEAYADFAPTDSIGAVDVTDAGVVRLRTFSKAHGLAGMRVGYAMGNPETVGLLNRIRMHFGISCVSLAGALAAQSDTDHLDFVVRETVQGRARMKEMATRAGFTMLPSATNFVLIDLGSKPKADALLNALLERGVFVRKPALPPLDGCVRITVGRSEDLDILKPIFAEAASGL